MKTKSIYIENAQLGGTNKGVNNEGKINRKANLERKRKR